VPALIHDFPVSLETTPDNQSPLPLVAKQGEQNSSVLYNFKSKWARQLTIDFAKYDIERAEYRSDISEHVSASQEIHCRQVWE
jgi:hypothetical protein